MKCHYFLLLLCSMPMFAKVTDEPQEIELKFKLPSPSLGEFKQAVLPKTSAPVTMRETYFMGPELQPACKNGYKNMPHYLRLRETNKGSFLTLKKRSLDGVVEYETKIDAPAMMVSILHTLGYGTDESDVVRLNKQRTKCNVSFEGHQIEVVFDTFTEPAHMKDMGEFTEIELKSAVPSYQEGMIVLKRFLRAQGITEIDVYPPYVELAINGQCAEQVQHLDLR